MLAANTDSSVEMEREKIKIKKGCHAKIAPFFGPKEDELCLDTEKLGNVLVLDSHNSISDAVTLLYHSI